MKNRFPITLCLLACSPALAQGQGNGAQEPTPDIERLERLFDMDPVELLQLPTRLATGTEQGWLNTPAAAHILTREDLMNSGHRHVAEQLRMVPGMLVSKTPDSSWSVSTRSFQHRFSKLQLVLQDGREIHSTTFGAILWETADLPVEILDSIEVVRGPGSTLWGSNAINGVINIRTLPAIDAQQNILTVGDGTNDSSLFSFRQGGKIAGGHYYTWGKWSNTLDQRHVGGGAMPDAELKKAGFRADLPGFGENGWTIQAEIFEHDTFLHFGDPGVIDTLGNWHGGILPETLGQGLFNGGTIQGEWSGMFAGDAEWRLRSYFTSEEREWHALSMTTSHDTFEIDFQVGKKIGRHGLLAGYQHMTNSYGFEYMDLPASFTGFLGSAASYLMLFPTDPGNEHIDRGFIQDTIDLSDTLHLLIGTKFEDNVTGEYWIPSARIWWEQDQETTWWGSVSKARQLPGYDYRNAVITYAYQDDGAGGYTAVTSLPPSDIDPAELTQWEIGWRHLFPNRLSLDITGFYGEFDKLYLVGAEERYNRGSLNTADTYGGEIALNWHPDDHLRIRSSVSYSDTDITGAATNSNAYSSAKWRGNLLAFYTPPGPLSYNLGVYATEKPFATVPGFIRTDVGVTWQPGDGWEISLQAQNLADPYHTEDYSNIHGASVHEIPRTIFAQVRKYF